MCADIYLAQQSRSFLLVPKGAGLDSVPCEVLSSLGVPVFFTTRDLSDPLLSVDTSRINEDLATRGFSLREL